MIDGEIGFGRFRLDLARRELWRDGVPVRLGNRALDILCELVSAEGGVVTKDELMARVWAGVVVEENNLQVHISALRRALEEGGDGKRWIVTVPGRGYSFLGPILASEDADATAPPPRVDTPRDAAPVAHDATAPPPRVLVPQEAAPVAHGEPERRQITALSCELVGAAAGAHGIDLEDWREAIGEFQRCVLETAERHKGLVYKPLGNNALVLFGYPEAHEHDAERGGSKRSTSTSLESASGFISTSAGVVGRGAGPC